MTFKNTHIIFSFIFAIVVVFTIAGAFGLTSSVSLEDGIVIAPLVAEACCGGGGGDGDDNSDGVHNPPPPPPPPTPVCTISASPTEIKNGGNSTLTWSSSNATSASIDQGIGNVAVHGSQAVSPTASITYTMTVSGPGGSANCSAAITVTEPPTPTVPSCVLHANPNSIEDGETALLEWTSTNATSASLNQGIGSVSTNGTYSVSPSSTRTYTLTVTGSGGTATCSETIGVVPHEPPHRPSPSCTLTLNYTSGYAGGARLSWFSSNAYSAWINNGIGAVPLSGTRNVPVHYGNRTYIMTVEGIYGERATCYATVNRPYTPPPQPPIYQPPVHQPPITIARPQPIVNYRTVSVAQVPYTGPEDTLYVLSMLLVALGAGAGIWINRERFGLSFSNAFAGAGASDSFETAVGEAEIVEDEVHADGVVEDEQEAGDSLTLEKTDNGPKLNFRRRS